MQSPAYAGQKSIEWKSTVDGAKDGNEKIRKGRRMDRGSETYMHISEPFVDLLEFSVVRDEIIDVHRTVQVICAPYKITRISISAP